MPVGVFRAAASWLRLLLLLPVPPLLLSPTRLRPVSPVSSRGTRLRYLPLLLETPCYPRPWGKLLCCLLLVVRSLHAWRGGVQVPFPTSSDSLPLGQCLSRFAPYGRVSPLAGFFFPLKEVFPAVSPLSPMSFVSIKLLEKSTKLQ